MEALLAAGGGGGGGAGGPAPPLLLLLLLEVDGDELALRRPRVGIDGGGGGGAGIGGSLDSSGTRLLDAAVSEE